MIIVLADMLCSTDSVVLRIMFQRLLFISFIGGVIIFVAGFAKYRKGSVSKQSYFLISNTFHPGIVL